MADIKTRNAVEGRVKTIDRALIAGQHIKQSYLSTRDESLRYAGASKNTEVEYATNQVEQKAEEVAMDGVHKLNKSGRNGFDVTKSNIKTRIKELEEKRGKKAVEKQAVRADNKKEKGDDGGTIKRSASRRKRIDKASKNRIVKDAKITKSSQKPIRKFKITANDTKQVAETTRKTATVSSKVTKKTVQIAKTITKAVAKGVKTATKATVKTVKATISTIKSLVAAIAAGGWVAVVAIVVICLSALLLGSVFGIFFAGEDTGTGQTIQTVVHEINSDYDNKLMSIRDKSSYDVLEMKGSRAVWKEVLAVYSVKVNTDPDNPQEVVTMNDAKKKLLKTIFWDMNNISSRTEDKLETVITETDDGNGNIVQIKNTERRTYLYITVSHKTAYDMASKYGFNQEQRKYLDELLGDENNSLWSSVLYGTSGEDNQIVAVALSQVGMLAVDHIGLGMVSTAELSGARALSVGVLMSADILKQVLFQSMPAVLMEFNGSKSVGSGLTELLNLFPA